MVIVVKGILEFSTLTKTCHTCKGTTKALTTAVLYHCSDHLLLPSMVNTSDAESLSFSNTILESGPDQATGHKQAEGLSSWRCVLSHEALQNTQISFEQWGLSEMSEMIRQCSLWTLLVTVKLHLRIIWSEQ